MVYRKTINRKVWNITLKHIQISSKCNHWRRGICLFVLSALLLPASSCPAKAATNNQADWTKRVITHTVTNPNSELLHFRFLDQNKQEVSLTQNSVSLQTDPLTQGSTSLQTDSLTQGSASLQTGSLTQGSSTALAPAALQSLGLSTRSHSVLKGASDLPASYDLRDYGVITSIKDQGNSGACWAFGTLKSAESNAIRKGLLTKNRADFSENHLAWFAFHPSERGGDKLITDGFYPISSSVDAAYTWGGSSLIALFTLARWSGVVPESTAPFQSDTLAKRKAMAQKMQKNGETLRYRSNYHMQNATCYDAAPTSAWKKALMNTSALAAGMYYSTTYASKGSAGATYYQTAYTGSAAVKSSNHCVTIIGWDDNYSRLNFPSIHRPKADGAWLVANSYGSKTDENGYFWLSYEEPSICDVYAFELEKNTNYDTNYQYDGFGWGSAIPDTTSPKGANIFRVRSDYNQSLKAVGIYTITDAQKVTIQIYKNVTSGYPTSGKLVKASTTTVSIPYNGFHTITLAKPAALTGGSAFSVVVTYHSQNNAEAYLPIEGAGASTNRVQSLYNSETGQSFYYSRTAKSWVDTSAAGQNNVCIKAFAKNTTPKPTLSFRSTKIVLGKRETLKLPLTAKHISASQISYKSNKKKIVSVTANGKIRAKKRGTAKITAYGKDVKASLKIIVKKAPSSVALKAKKKVLKKGSALQLTVSLSKHSASRKRTFRSSNPKVLKVSSDGIVYARKKGTATITVITYNRQKAKLKLRVK